MRILCVLSLLLLYTRWVHLLLFITPNLPGGCYGCVSCSLQCHSSTPFGCLMGFVWVV